MTTQKHYLQYHTYIKTSLFKDTLYVHYVTILTSIIYATYIHCFTYTSYNVRLQTDTCHIICKKEELIQKILTITRDKKDKIVSGINKSKNLTGKPKSTAFSKLDFLRLKIRIRRVKYGLRAASQLEPTCRQKGIRCYTSGEEFELEVPYLSIEHTDNLGRK